VCFELGHSPAEQSRVASRLAFLGAYDLLVIPGAVTRL
jgi:hypothetical protein